MTRYNPADDVFSQMDANRDGVIDRGEFNDWQGKPTNDVVTTLPYAPSVTRIGPTRYDRYPYVSGYPTTYETIPSRYPPTLETTTAPYPYGYPTTGAIATTPEVVTSSPEETNRYLETQALHIYRGIPPQIIRRPNPHCPLTTEQRVLVRYLQPPPLPPPEPIIIKEVRPPPLAPAAPLVIREQARIYAQAALYLRERPPVPPPRQAGRVEYRYLPAQPAPRSLIVERYPAWQKPGDIIIERWLPYQTTGVQRTIVQRAPPETRLAPQYIVHLYDECRPTVVRKFENLGVIEENPEAYRARYGATLLDTPTLLQYARNAGVVEDLALPYTTGVPRLGVEYGRPSYPITTINPGYTRPINPGYTTINPVYPITTEPVYPTTIDPGYTTIDPRLTPTNRSPYERIHRVPDTEPGNLGSKPYSTEGYVPESSDQPNPVYETTDGAPASDSVLNNS
jgi:hypothetical protein